MENKMRIADDRYNNTEAYLGKNAGCDMEDLAVDCRLAIPRIFNLSNRLLSQKDK